MIQRISCRGIIFKNGKIAIMHRIKEDRDYYTFPGGGLEDDENKENCIVREIVEELGINIKPIKQVYEYHNDSSIQYFYLCEWIDGDFGSGRGPEMINYLPHKGQYIPTLQDISTINTINLMPPEITEKLLKDIEKFGLELDSNLKIIEDTKNQ